MEKRLKILVSPLNWGLGHATRLVPIILHYKNKGHDILLAGEGGSLAFLKGEFPNLPWVELPSFSPRFSKSSSQILKLAKQIPNFFFMIFNEYRNTKDIVKKYGIDTIISDNRYGVHNHRCHSVIITHQLSPFVTQKEKGFRRWVVSFGLNILVSRFDRCWIPDIHTGESLTGELTKPVLPLKHVMRVGLLSRFNPDETPFSPGGAPLAIISGPEPQRTIFENMVVRFFEQRNEEATIIRGLPLHPHKLERKGKIILLSHCSSQEFALLIRSAQFIVCRSGYSTIMDLLVLGRRALLVPTPGQTEQEYLALRMRNFNFEYASQDNLLYIDRQNDFSAISAIYPPVRSFKGAGLEQTEKR